MTVAKVETIHIQLQRWLQKEKNSPMLARAPYGLNVRRMEIWKIQIWQTIAAQSLANPRSWPIRKRVLSTEIMATQWMLRVMLDQPATAIPAASHVMVKYFRTLNALYAALASTWMRREAQKIARIARLDSTTIKMGEPIARSARLGSTTIKMGEPVVNPVPTGNTKI